MENIEVQKVMDRSKVANSIHTILDTGVSLLQKDDKFTADDHVKLKTIRTLAPHISAGVFMIQQETAQQKIVIIQERLRTLGYNEPKQIESSTEQ